MSSRRLVASSRCCSPRSRSPRCVAPLTERGLLRFFYGRDEVLLVLVTYALFLILEDVTKLVWGVNPYYVSGAVRPVRQRRGRRAGLFGYDFMLVGARASSSALAVWWGLNRTRQGKLVLAVIHSEEVAASMGINVSRFYMLAFTFGIFLAALGGAFTAPMISVQPGVSVGVIIVSFAVVIIGGLGSIAGAALGALIVGLARSLAVHLAPVAELFSIYIVMAVVLMFRPEGLFQRTRRARKTGSRWTCDERLDPTAVPAVAHAAAAARMHGTCWLAGGIALPRRCSWPAPSCRSG